MPSTRNYRTAVLAPSPPSKHKRPTDQLHHMHQARHISDEQDSSNQSQPTKHKRPTDPLQHMHQARHITDQQVQTFKQAVATNQARATDRPTPPHASSQAHTTCLIQAINRNQPNTSDRETNSSTCIKPGAYPTNSRMPSSNESQPTKHT